MFSVQKKILSRPITVAECDLFQKWVGLPHIRRWWLDEWSEKAYEDMKSEQDFAKANGTFLQIIDEDFIGVCQIYSNLNGEHKYLALDDCGIRFFIGETKLLHKKIGKVLISTLAGHLFRKTQTQRIICEPQADNWPAIITLKRAGFRDRGRVKRPGRDLVQLTLRATLYS